MNDTYISGVIFDFNGTLFNDTDFHDQAWKEFAGKYGKKLNNEDLDGVESYHLDPIPGF